MKKALIGIALLAIGATAFAQNCPRDYVVRCERDFNGSIVCRCAPY